MTAYAVSLIESFGYLGIFALMLVETAFPPLPSEVIVPFAGFAASQGNLNLWTAIIAATGGSLVGAWLLYMVSTLLGDSQVESWVNKYGKWIGLKVSDLEKAQSWFDKHGTWAVFLCRLLPGLRSLISIPAGYRRMKLLPFLLYSAVGTIIWTAILAIGGYQLGENYELLKTKLEPLSLIVLVIVALAVGILLWRRLTAKPDTTNDL